MPGRETAPVEAPQSIEPEAPPVPGIDAGLLGGVEGGVEGGVVGGIVGGLVSAVPRRHHHHRRQRQHRYGSAGKSRRPR